jgi:putative phosphoribosyl transferase
VRIAAAGVELAATLSAPADALGVVAFAHGTGSSRFSPRNRWVAEGLHGRGMATLLMDLLTSEEEMSDARTGHLRFDIPLLANRLVAAVDWVATREGMRGFPIGLFGASTGAGAALSAAASRPDLIRAVVSRGGRPDLAGDDLPAVRAPTLLIVGGADRHVLELNKLALARMRARARLEIVPGATHLFEEPGALEEVTRLAADWFLRFLTADT